MKGSHRIFPWQQPAWDRLMQAKAAGVLPHALLMDGPAGIGKRHLAAVFLRSLYCEQPQADGVCGRCRHCRWFDQGHHPDCFMLQPDAQGKIIPIDKVRELTAFFSLKSHGGGIKTALVQPADAMLPAAANSLLKTLEEPPGHCCLVLVSEYHGKLLPTIRSRCHRYALSPIGFEQAKDWLKRHSHEHDSKRLYTAMSLAQGAPLRAQQWLEEGMLDQRREVMDAILGLLAGKANPLKVAGGWLKGGLAQPLYWLSTFVLDVMRLQVSENPPRLCHTDIREAMQVCTGLGDPLQWHRLLAEVNRTRGLLNGSANAQLLAENVLLQLAELGSRS